MVFEDQFAALNETYFFREFTFSKSTFYPAPTRKVELADSLIWLGNFLVIFQLKERKAGGGTTPEAEKRWFERKVLKKATQQVQDTLIYLDESNGIEVRNHKGHAFSLSVDAINEQHKLIVYLPHESLPETHRRIKHHWSRSAGFIHIMQATDYLGVIKTLITPTEVVDYLNFREILITDWGNETSLLPEQALVGQFLKGDSGACPSVEFAGYLQRLDQRSGEWDVSGLINTFNDQVWTDNLPTDYYHIVREIALLKRDELREIKKRVLLSFENARANKAVRPYRVACPRTGCGFVFVPLAENEIADRHDSLASLTLAHKYDQRLYKCIGASFSHEENDQFKAEWFYAEFPWKEDREMEELLKEHNPFRKVTGVVLDRYTFDQHQ
ncbi:MAG: hypothetical protein L0196_04795 [candidate division Zixibacteria bacterium]|nr:hypothetical protein [candidate division Zixibacteria bacterium]